MRDKITPRDWAWFNKGIKVACNKLSDLVLGTDLSKAKRNYPEIEQLANKIKESKAVVARVPKGWSIKPNAKVNVAGEYYSSTVPTFQ